MHTLRNTLQFSQLLPLSFLEGAVVMDFRHPNGQHVAVLLPRRSLAVLTREARYVWTHGTRVCACVSMLMWESMCTVYGCLRMCNKVRIVAAAHLLCLHESHAMFGQTISL